jgi:hypothetical protein
MLPVVTEPPRDAFPPTDDPADGPLGEELLLENDRVRVWQDRVEPGGQQEIHTHRRPYLSVVVRGAHGQIVGADGNVDYEMDRTPGEVRYFGDVPRTHALRNTGDEPIEVVVIELL